MNLETVQSMTEVEFDNLLLNLFEDVADDAKRAHRRMGYLRNRTEQSENGPDQVLLSYREKLVETIARIDVYLADEED